MLWQISTHTPVRVWLQQRLHHSGEKHFNSHTREGVTFNPVVNMVCIGNFNSHTREGVTLTIYPSQKCWTFQLTHPWGCDWKMMDMITPVLKFQLTHPWGCDFVRLRDTIFSLYFNSHTREGVTTARLKRNVPFGISTHTPVRVWLFWNSYGIFNAISTHTPVRVWPNLAISCIITSGFQLTHPWGCDKYKLIEYVIFVISTHTPVRVWQG